MTMFNEDELERRFGFHQPRTELTKLKHEQARAACKNLMTFLDHLLPDCREKAIISTHIEEAMFWANAGIARNQ